MVTLKNSKFNCIEWDNWSIHYKCEVEDDCINWKKKKNKPQTLWDTVEKNVTEIKVYLLRLLRIIESSVVQSTDAVFFAPFFPS